MRTLIIARPPLLLVVLAAIAVMLAVTPAGAQPTTAFDGDPATTERIDAGDPVSAAIMVSRQRFDAAPHAVLATSETFADSLAGAALTADGPLLLTAGDALSPDTATELDRVLADGATVYVLGGTDAISGGVAQSLTDRGFVVDRLAGETRVETALAVADEVRRLHPSTTVLLARSDGAPGNPTSAFADSMTGGSLAAAARLPILVTPTEQLHPAVSGWLTSTGTATTVLLGGRAALSQAVEDAVPGGQRLSGPERTATAAAIAGSDLWPRSAERRFVILDGARADGWAYGLSAAGIAADAGAPPLLVGTDTVSAATRRLVSTCGPADVDLLLVGDEQVVSAAVADQLTAFDGQACADGRTALRPFDSCEATLAHFVEEGLSRVGPYGLDGYWYGAVVAEGVVEDDAAEGGSGPPLVPAPSAPDASGGDGGDTPVSGTNVQEAGVDEPDRVKANASALYVTGAGPGVEVMALTDDGPTHVGTLDVGGRGYSSELLLDDDVLLVISRGDTFAQPVDGPPPGTTFAPEPAYPEPSTVLTRFDVSEPTTPVLLDTAELSGENRSARLVDGVVRVVTSANPRGLDFTWPTEDSDQARDAALAHNRQVIQDSTIEQWLPTVATAGGQDLAVACEDVFAPPAFAGISTAVVVAFDMAGPLVPTSSAAVVGQADTLYASTQRLVLSSSRWGEWSPEAPSPTVTTEVHSFDISQPDRTTYVASGQVDGYVLNQFSISERDAYYRIATTTEPPWTEPFGPDGPRTDNGVTVLTEGGGELFQVGRVFGLGEGERIFAVRFLGDVAAVVTFRQTDPLYLLDLRDPAAPRVTGELSIPGVSRYLHPVGEDLLLGVGQDGTADGELTGVQVSLFDISDRTAPTRVDSVEYGEGYSPVESDHRAFLYWSPLGRAFVPVYSYGPGPSGVEVVDVAGGQLTASGRLLPPDGSGYSADRSIVVGDTVYAVGYEGVSAHDLTTLAPRGWAPFPS